MESAEARGSLRLACGTSDHAAERGAATRDLGQLFIEIGMSPVKPAEFVIFRIGQWTADRKV